MRPRTLLLLLLALVLLVPLVAAFGLWSIDSSYLRRLIVTRVEQATGRSLSIDGPVDVSWSLHPVFTLHGIALANSPTAADPTMLSVERLALQVDALSLLSGRPELERLSVTGLDLLLEQGPDGAGNWVFQRSPSGEPTSADAEPGPADADSLPIVRQVLVADARIRYRGAGGATTELKLARAALDASSTSASFTFGLDGSLDGKPLRSKGRLGSIDALAGAGDMPLVLTDFSVVLGDSDLAGTASLRFDGERPQAVADLSAERLDLLDLHAPQGEAATAADQGRLFSTVPLPFGVLRGFDLQLHLRAGSVETPAVALGQVELDAALEAGRLQIQPLGFRLQDRPLGGELLIDAGDDPARLELKLNGDDLDIGRLLASLTPGVALEGRGDIRLQATGRGDTPHALASSATGTATVLMGAGKLPTDLLGQLGGGVRQLLADATVTGRTEAASFTCAALVARAENGLAKLDLLAEGRYSTLVGGGTVDLGRELIDLTLTPQARQLDLDVALPVTIRGPLLSPSVDLDKGGATRRVASLLGGIVFPPAALGAFVDLGSAESNHCLELAAHPERLEAPTGVDPNAGVVDQIEGAGRKLLDAVRPTP